jgi:hypothetical protein
MHVHQSDKLRDVGLDRGAGVPGAVLGEVPVVDGANEQAAATPATVARPVAWRKDLRSSCIVCTPVSRRAAGSIIAESGTRIVDDPV